MIGKVIKADNPVIIYCDEDLANELESHKIVLKKNMEDHKYLRTLDSQSLNPILIVTEDHLMRGFDYRSTQGIDLYLCKAFPSQNDLD